MMALVYRQEVSCEDVLHLLFKAQKFVPTAMIDDNKWLTPAHFGHNQRIWQQAVGQCLAITDRTLIRFYAYVE
ncbi:MAG TPA: hypothetical protein VE954_29325 [Oligoflexus sp.]|uniref:hypothetical protein n=1 Tax=Oligoflexus sp. TaxID=1971216 RepID=UPI002D25C980|nr:hypothetical protein [Oligoflexus sp.]HYX37225.1 hypothetical protein [Oligoflexus sp.]